MAEERRTVEDCLARMRAARRRGKRSLARYWESEAMRTRMLELAAAADRDERRAGRGTVVDLFCDPALDR